MGSVQDVTVQFRQRGMAILKDEGIAGLMKQVIGRLSRSPLHFSYCIVALSLDHLIQVPMPAVDVEAAQIEATDDDDLEVLVNFGKYGGPKELLLQRLADGRRCYVAKSGGRIVSCNWVYEGEFDSAALARRLKLADDELYYTDVFTSPEFRGKGFMPYLMAQSVSDIKARNQHKTCALTFIVPDNKASLRGAAKAGFKRVGRVGWFEILGVRVHYLLGRNVLPETTQRIFIERE